MTEKKLGKTFGGVHFEVPETFDFLENLYKRPLNLFDYALLVALVFQVYLFLFSSLPSWFFACLFGFWRLAYNVGLGYLLHQQSNKNFIVNFLSKYLEEGSSSRSFIKAQFTKKMGSDYDFEKVPIEYNCWLLYRALVDFILLCDFFTYFLFVFAYFEIPESFGLLEVVIYTVGLVMVVFNWFIKMDALRVVKDFAWYWGDFFFLIDSELTFDGVFQMAPHPMYSIGYIGYYGVSLMSQNYIVLYGSLMAHLCQFLFLGFVENPHIDKIYNSVTHETPTLKKQRAILYEGPSAYFRRDLLVFKNFDPFRSADVFTALVLAYSVIIYLMNLPTWFYVLQCLAWRVLHSAGLGFVLKRQSEDKVWTMHYLKYGFTAQEAFGNWKSIYNLSLTMTHVSFFFCSLRFFQVPEDLFYGTVLLRHTLGVILVALHIWTSVEVYEVIGDYGWFYGDFFVTANSIDPEYSGIYRFLNNPEKVMGHAGQYGLALISGSWVVFAIVLFSQIMTFLFLHYVEGVHMKKVYGVKVRKASGLTAALTDKIKPLKAVSALTKNVAGSAENLMNALESRAKEVKDPMNLLVDRAKPKISSIVDNISERTSKIATGLLKDVNPSQFKIKCPKVVALGQPITVEWSAPEEHSERDWIGIYPVGRKSSNEGLTVVSSKGRWNLVGQGTSGNIKFSSDKLPWKPGRYEFRYHHDYGYVILAVSEIIEVTLGPGLEIAEDLKHISKEELSTQLLEIWKRLFEKDDLALEDSFHSLAANEKARDRKAMALMVFIKNVYGVDFSPKILDAFPTVSVLSEKLKEAVEALTTVGEPFHESDEDQETSAASEAKKER